MCPTDLRFSRVAGLACLMYAAGIVRAEPNPIGLVPTPQQFKPIETTFELDPDTPIVLSGRCSSREVLIARLLQGRIRRIAGLRLPIALGSSRRGIRLFLSGTPEGTAALTRHGQRMPVHVAGSARGWASDYRSREEYFLHVGRDNVTVVANTPQGLLHGAMTLAQLVAPDELILGCEVLDWPEMRFRGVYLRLRGSVGSETIRPTCGQIKSVIETMARFKLNHLLLEPGDGAALPSLPGGSRLEALTVGQQREIRQFAEAMGVHVVPVLDSWSRVNHRTTYPALRPLIRDGRFDLRDPATADVLARMATDLDANLNNSAFIHLGGRGACEDLDVYTLFHARLAARVREATGKRPMIWAMSRGTPAPVLAAWPRDIVVVPDHPTNPRGGWYRDGVRIDDVWASGLGSGHDQIGLATPLIEGAVGGGMFADWAQYERHLTVWADAAYRLGRDRAGLGIVGGFESLTTPGLFEAALPLVCWLAELAWNDARAGGLPDDRFDRAVGWQLCGVATEGERVLQACRTLSELAAGPAQPEAHTRRRLAEAVRRLSCIRFPTYARPIGEAVCRAAGVTAGPAAGRGQPSPDLPLAVAGGAKWGLAGRDIAFDASASRDAAGGRSVTVTWDFGDGTRSHDLAARHVYREPGTYVAALTVRDRSGASRCEPLLVTVGPVGAAVADGSAR